MQARGTGFGLWGASTLFTTVLCVSTGVAAAPGPSRPPEAKSAVAAPPAYVDPPPMRVYRFHVYATMKQRRTRRVVVESLVSTSGSSSVQVGDKAVLERSVQASPASPAEWVPAASVIVTKISSKGRIEVEIESEEPEATLKRKGRTPFAAGQKVRLQIDRLLPAG